jgi:hypothetical protein
MKTKIKALNLLILSFLHFTNGIALAASEEKDVENQRLECSKNKSQEWSAQKNRCVSKLEDQLTRKEVEACAKLTDVTQQADCYKKIAEKKTNLDSNVDNLDKGNVNKSLIMNGIGAAYGMLGMINGIGQGKKSSSCTSKKIFGITALAGVVTDLMMKNETKKKLDELKTKYQISVKNSAFENQSKAFEFLKEEQMTVKDIASKEKKRNMLLMLGYGAASVMAIYEMTTANNPGCYSKEGGDSAPSTTPPAATPSVASVPTTGIEGGASASVVGASGTSAGVASAVGAKNAIAGSRSSKRFNVTNDKQGNRIVKSEDGKNSIVGKNIIENSTKRIVGNTDETDIDILNYAPTATIISNTQLK